MNDDSERAPQRGLVTTLDGNVGRAERIEGDRTRVTLSDGAALIVSNDLLEPRSDGSQLLRVRLAGGESTTPATVIPVIREELDVGKRVIETDSGVRVHKRVSERREQVVQLLYREDLDVERVPRNELVSAAPPIRHEGTTLVIPLCEEVLVIEKRLLLKEEVRVSRRERHIRHAEEVVLRSEQATIERFGDSNDGAD